MQLYLQRYGKKFCHLTQQGNNLHMSHVVPRASKPDDVSPSILVFVHSLICPLADTLGVLP